MNAQELIVELADGALGRVWLGRGLAGEEAGRLISVRLTAWKDVTASDKRELATGIAMAQRLRHARIAKTLTACVDGDQLLILGEYIEGEHLCSLRSVLARRGAPLSPPVATRIVLEALRSGDAATQQLRALGDTCERRLLFPDTLLLASYGQVLVSDVAVADALFRIHSSELDDRGLAYAGSGATGSAAQADVLAAGVLLWELLTNQTAATGKRPPVDQIPRLDTGSPQGRATLGAVALRKVTDTLTRALETDPARRFQTLADMARAFESLPSDWLADEERVRNELRSLARGRFAARQRLLGVDTNTLSPESCPPASSEAPSSDSAGTALAVSDFDAPTRNALRAPLALRALVPTPVQAKAVEASLLPEITTPPRAFNLPLSSQPPQLGTGVAGARRRSPAWMLGAAALGVLVGGLLVSFLRQGDEMTADPERTRSRAAGPGLPAAAHAVVPEAEPSSSASPSEVKAAAPAPRAPSAPRPAPAESASAAASASAATSASPAVAPAASTPAANSPAEPSDGAQQKNQNFHPRSISPYRPRGI